MADGGLTKLLDAQLKSRVDGTAILQLVGWRDRHVFSRNSCRSIRFDLGVPTREPGFGCHQCQFHGLRRLHALIEGKRVIHAQGTRMFLVPSTQVRRVLDLVFPEPLFAARVASVEEALSRIHLQASSDRN